MDRSEAMEKIEDMVSDPHAPLRDAKEGGKEVVGYVCSYVPSELIHSAGLIPIRLLLGPAPGDTAGMFMQGFCCSFARSILEGLGDGTYDYLSAVVMPHTCDTIRNMSDLVESVDPDLRVFKLMVPTITHTGEALDFMVEELRALKVGLEGLASRDISDFDLWKSIDLYNHCRSALEALRGSKPGNRELYAAYLAGQLMPPEDFLRLAESIEGGQEQPGGMGVALVGGPVPQLEIFDLLQEYGLEVVWDDVCTASRYADGMVAEGGDPLRALAERYLGRVPCPTKLDPENRREDALMEGIEASGAAGVVFIQQSFCEFHSFDYPHLKKRLDGESIPNIRLDLEQPFQPTGQMKTRLQALAEIIAERV